MSGKKRVVLLGLLAQAAYGGGEGEAEPATPVQGASMEETCGQVRNLLRNPGFEKGRGALTDDWQRNAFIFREDLFAWVKNKSFRGRASVRVSIPPGMPNDASWSQRKCGAFGEDLAREEAPS